MVCERKNQTSSHSLGQHSPDTFFEEISTALVGRPLVRYQAAGLLVTAATPYFRDGRMTFVPFDPLAAKNIQVTEAALSALKREIINILSSYVGWYDPFAELIQNALDSVEARVAVERAAGTGTAYQPQVRILIDLDANALTVTDNGVGLDKEKFEQFLAPNFSFKSGSTRGHKGVGATYVAYGFNYMRVSTKVPGFQASGRIVNARDWINDNGTGANPKVE